MGTMKASKVIRADKYIGVTVEPATLKELKKAAQKDNRPVSQFVRILIEKALATK